jgi:hypothetical protein
MLHLGNKDPVGPVVDCTARGSLRGGIFGRL